MNMKPRPSYPRTTPASSAPSAPAGWDFAEEAPLSSSVGRESAPIARETPLQREPVAPPAAPSKIVDVEEDDDCVEAVELNKGIDAGIDAGINTITTFLTSDHVIRIPGWFVATWSGLFVVYLWLTVATCGYRVR